MSKRKPGRLIHKSEITEEFIPISISDVDYNASNSYYFRFLEEYLQDD